MNKNTKFNKRLAILPRLFALLACALLIGCGGLTSITSSSRAPLMVSEVVNNKSFMNQQIRVSGAVVGESITVDEKSQQLSFLIADIPVDEKLIEQGGGINTVLEDAVNDPDRQRLQVLYVGDKPELLTNMVHAIIIGELHSDGILYADSIALVISSNH